MAATAAYGRKPHATPATASAMEAAYVPLRGAANMNSRLNGGVEAFSFGACEGLTDAASPGSSRASVAQGTVFSFTVLTAFLQTKTSRQAPSSQRGLSALRQCVWLL